MEVKRVFAHLVAALWLLAAIPARAEWVKVIETYEGWDYFDPTTIRRVGGLRRVWQMQDLKLREPSGELSRRLLGEYDCKEDRWRILSFTLHSGPLALGEILANRSSEPSKWFDVAPGTVAETLLRLVCTR